MVGELMRRRFSSTNYHNMETLESRNEPKETEKPDFPGINSEPITIEMLGDWFVSIWEKHSKQQLLENITKTETFRRTFGNLKDAPHMDFEIEDVD